jgi:hypothetical protein
MKGATIVIEGRRWFDGSNTYHTARVVVVKGHEVTFDEVATFEYGYGDCYMESATRLLVGRDLIGEARKLMRSRAAVVINSIVDVSRRRDLHNGGKS